MKSQSWKNILKHDPIPTLQARDNVALRYFVRRDLLDDDHGSVDQLWDLPDVRKILKKQQKDGSWNRSGKYPDIYPDVNYRLVETWKNLRYLVDMYGMNREHPAIERACECVFSCQTGEGDIRGFLANQYATYYTGALLSLLIKAGYQGDPRTEKCFNWLLDMRQDDGGWTIPILTVDMNKMERAILTSAYAKPIEPDRTKPFSHNWTGMVLRAYAADRNYRNSKEAKKAAKLLKSRFFKPDVYTSYKSADYWVKFDFPFWWNNLVSAMDSLFHIDSKIDTDIQTALDWFVDKQEENGLWKTSNIDDHNRKKTSTKSDEVGIWVTLAICRILKRFLK